MGVLPAAGKDEQPTGRRFDERVGAPVGVEEFKEPALKVLAVLAQVQQARVVVVRRVVLVYVRVPVGVVLVWGGWGWAIRKRCPSIDQDRDQAKGHHAPVLVVETLGLPGRRPHDARDEGRAREVDLMDE